VISRSEDAYDAILKVVTEFCEAGEDAEYTIHALIRNAVELAVIHADNNQAELRRILTEATKDTLLTVVRES